MPLITPPGGRLAATEQQFAKLVTVLTRLRAEKTALETRLQGAQFTGTAAAVRDLAKAGEKCVGCNRKMIC